MKTKGIDNTQKMAMPPSNCVVVPALLGRLLDTLIHDGQIHLMQIDTKFEP